MSLGAICSFFGHVTAGILFWSFFTLTSSIMLIFALLFVSLQLLVAIFVFPFNNFLGRQNEKYVAEQIEKYETILMKKLDCFEKIKHIYIPLSIKGIDVLVHCFMVDGESTKDEVKKNCVLIHGTAGSCISFLNMIETLSKSYTVYAIDLPGFGRSHVNENFKGIKKIFQEDSSDFYCEVLNEFLKSRRIEKSTLCGHSFGGYICIKFAKLYPDQTNGIVLLNPAGIFPTLGSLGCYWAVIFKLSIPHIGRPFGRFGLSAVEYFSNSPETLYWYFLTSHPLSFGDLFVRERISLSLLSACWNQPSFNDLKLVKTPILCIYGENDTIMPPHQGMILSQVHGITFKVIPGAGHNPSDSPENGKIVAEYMNSFDLSKKQLISDLKLENEELFKSSFYIPRTISQIQKLYSYLGVENAEI